jgi:teichuronic acid exporter
MSIESRTASALKWTVIGRLLGQTAAWLVTLIVIRILSPADYGLMALVAVVMSIATTLAELGLVASIVQTRHLDPGLLRQLCGFVVLLHISIALIIAGAAPLAAFVFEAPQLTLLIQAASLQFVFLAICAMPYALATRAMLFKWLATVELITGVATSLATLALAWKGFAVWSLVLGALVGHAVRAVLLVVGGENPRPVFRFSGLAGHIGFGSRLAASRFVWTAVSQADIMIGGKLFARDALGAYSVATHLATLPMQKVMSVVNTVAFPAVARLQDEGDRLRQRILQGSRLLTALSVPVAWGMSSVAADLVPVVLSSKWQSAVFPLQVVTLVVPLRMISSMFATAIVATGRAQADLTNTLVTAIAWPTCFAVGAQWGVDGLAASWLFAVPATFALNYSRTGGALGIPFLLLLTAVRAPLLAGLAMIAAVHGAHVMLQEVAAFYRLMSLVLVGACVYIPVAVILDRELTAEGRRLVGAMLGKE